MIWSEIYKTTLDAFIIPVGTGLALAAWRFASAHAKLKLEQQLSAFNDRLHKAAESQGADIILKSAAVILSDIPPAEIEKLKTEGADIIKENFKTSLEKFGMPAAGTIEAMISRAIVNKLT